MVFYELTLVSYLQLQPPCYCTHHLLHSADLSFINPLVSSPWHLIPILSSDFTRFIVTVTHFPSFYLTCVPLHPTPLLLFNTCW